MASSPEAPAAHSLQLIDREKHLSTAYTQNLPDSEFSWRRTPH
jgi:hypothetical protein